MRSLRRRLIKGAALNLLAVAFNQGSTLIANIFVARLLIQQSFGEYSMVQSTLLTMAAISQLATGYTASRYIAEYRSIDPVRAGRIMGMCAISSAVTAGLGTLLLVTMSPWLAGTMLDAPHLASALIIGAAFVLCSSFNGYQVGALSGLEAYASLVKAGAASGIVAICAISFGAWWGGLNGALLGLSVSALFRCGIHYVCLRIESNAQGVKPLYLANLRRESAIIVKFAAPVAIAGYYSVPMIWLANTFLVHQYDGYKEMALYVAANNLRMIVMFLPGVINSVGLSILNNEKAKGDLSSYNQVFRSNVLYIFLVTLSGAVVMGIFGRQILGLFGKDFGAGYLILSLLLASSVFEGVNIALYQNIQAKEKMWLSLFAVNVPREAVFVSLAYLLCSSHGAAGLAFASLVSVVLAFMVIATISSYMLRDKVNTGEPNVVGG